MPIYEYLCKNCRELFEKNQTLEEHDGAPITCLRCGSENVEQVLTTFYGITLKKSA